MAQAEKEAEDTLAIVQAVKQPNKRRNAFGGDPKAAGRKGGLAKAANITAKLDNTREYLAAHGITAAKYVVSAYDHPDSDPTTDRGLRAATDVLDRTVGKAAQELRLGPAEQTMMVLRELENEE